MLTLNDGRNELWQWDTGRKLTVDADCSQVHFSNKVFGRSIDVDVVDGVAVIPDILLQTDKELTAWAFVGTPENGYTKISKVFKVNRRNKPADYVFTPTAQTTLEELVERLEKIEENQDPDAINKAVDDYLASNPIKIDETDPTVPEWAKQSTKPAYTAQEVGALPNTTIIPTVPTTLPNPYKLTFTGAVVAEYDGGKEVIVEIPEGGGSSDAVLYTEQKLTEEQREQARENIGAAKEQIPLSASQINALDALFKAASYIKDVSAEYAYFCEVFGITESDEPSEDVVSRSIKQGTISFENGMMHLNGAMVTRGTLVPIGQYLKKSTTYKFGIGAATNNYRYGVQTFVANSHALDFPYSEEHVDYDAVTERIIDSGWLAADYICTAERDNCILTVNFKKIDDTTMSEADYATILENFTIEEVVLSNEPAYLVHRSLTKLDDATMAIAIGVNTSRIMMYSAMLNAKVYAEHNGSYWANSGYSPLRIPVGAVSANVDVPSEMKYGVFIAKPHDTEANRVTIVVDSGWVTDGHAIDVSSYNDGNYYFGANIAYTSNAEIPADFDTSVLDVYFVDANGNRMS